MLAEIINSLQFNIRLPSCFGSHQGIQGDFAVTVHTSIQSEPMGPNPGVSSNCLANRSVLARLGQRQVRLRPDPVLQVPLLNGFHRLEAQR